jgi:hypothetical protein
MAGYPLTVSESDRERSAECVPEIRQAFEEGAEANGNQFLRRILQPGEFDAKYDPDDPDEEPKFPAFAQAFALAILRELRRLPVPLPAYKVADLPPASEHPFAICYVSDGADGRPVVAFSADDSEFGWTWLRCDDRMPVAP